MSRLFLEAVSRKTKDEPAGDTYPSFDLKLDLQSYLNLQIQSWANRLKKDFSQILTTDITAL